MKTRELIEQLQSLDPSGELECCIENHDISFLDLVPASYDGTLELIERSSEDNEVCSAVLETQGKKIRLHPLSIADAIFDIPALPVSINAEEPELIEQHEAKVAEWRQRSSREGD